MYIILLQTGGVTLATVLHTVRGVGGMGIRMLTIDTKTSLYVEDRVLHVPMVLEYDYIPHTYNCFFRSYDLLDWSTLILSDNKTHTNHTEVTTGWDEGRQSLTPVRGPFHTSVHHPPLSLELSSSRRTLSRNDCSPKNHALFVFLSNKCRYSFNTFHYTEE